MNSRHSGQTIDVSQLEVEVLQDELAIAGLNPDWDALLARSGTDTVFLSSAWLSAWADTLGRGRDLRLCRVHADDRLVAAAAFEVSGGVIEFAGRGPSDYADILVQSDLPDAEYLRVAQSLLSAAADSVGGFRHFQLLRVPARSRTVPLLESSDEAFFGTRLRSTPAPVLDMALVADRLKKKSLRRHANGLKRHGDVCCRTLADAELVMPRLDPFFEQHIGRWHGTDTPSQFLDEVNRDFFRVATERLGATGSLRFTDLTVDGKLAAAHFGFMHGGTFTWYKPCFDVALSRLSPGEVLLKHLLEQARDEGAAEFDFTIGDEAFKLRFASEIREVFALHVTDSQVSAMLRRARVVARRAVGSVRTPAAGPGR